MERPDPATGPGDAARTEDEIAWRLVEEISALRAPSLQAIFEQQQGRNGRLSIQTDPRFYRDPDAILRQAVRFHALAPNIVVKIPVTEAGITAIEEATSLGISINATVCFSVPQCIAVAEAVGRGLTRREAEHKDISTMGPVCTIMVGRLDDWLKVIADETGYHHRSKEPGMGRCGGLQAKLPAVSGAPVSYPLTVSSL